MNNDQVKRNRIKRCFERNKLAATDDLIEIAIKFDQPTLAKILVGNFNLDPLKADMISNEVEVVKNEQVPLVGPPPSPPNSFDGKTKAFAKRWWIPAAFVIVVIMIFWSRCSLHMPVTSNDTVSQSDFASLKTEVNDLKTDHDTRVGGLEKGVGELVGEHGVISNIAGEVDELQKKVGKLETEKADKSDLDKVKKRLKRVEKKLNAHIADEDDEIIMPTDEPVLPTVLPPGKTIVKVCKGGRKCKQVQ